MVKTSDWDLAFIFEGRDIRDKNIHPATFQIWLAKKCIELFTHEGELVIDPFVGSGTVLVAAIDLLWVVTPSHVFSLLALRDPIVNGVVPKEAEGYL